MRAEGGGEKSTRTGIQLIGVSAPGQARFGDEIEEDEFIICFM
jgi:hypothetical protein